MSKKLKGGNTANTIVATLPKGGTGEVQNDDQPDAPVPAVPEGSASARQRLQNAEDAHEAVGQQISSIEARVVQHRNSVEALHTHRLELAQQESELAGQVQQAKIALGQARVAATVAKGSDVEVSMVARIEGLSLELAELQEELEAVQIARRELEARADVQRRELEDEIRADGQELVGLRQTYYDLEAVRDAADVDLAEACQRELVRELQVFAARERELAAALSDCEFDRRTVQYSIQSRMSRWPARAAQLESEYGVQPEKPEDETTRLLEAYRQFWKIAKAEGMEVKRSWSITPSKVSEAFILDQRMITLLFDAPLQHRIDRSTWMQQRLDLLDLWLSEHRSGLRQSKPSR